MIAQRESIRTNNIGGVALNSKKSQSLVELYPGICLNKEKRRKEGGGAIIIKNMRQLKTKHKMN